MTFISGPYKATFDGKNLGKVQDGFRLVFTSSAHPVRGNNLAMTEQDAIYQGGSCFLSFILSEYNAPAVEKLIWPFDEKLGFLGKLGRRFFKFSKRILLERIDPDKNSQDKKTNASPKQLWANKAVLAPGFPLELLLASRPRVVPIRLQLFPYDPAESPGDDANPPVSGGYYPSTLSPLAWFEQKKE